MGEGGLGIGFVWMTEIERGSHKFSRGLLGISVCTLEESRGLRYEVVPSLHYERGSSYY